MFKTFTVWSASFELCRYLFCHINLVLQHAIFNGVWFSIAGDALADGSTIEWQYYKALEGLTEDELEKLPLEKIRSLEAECIEKKCLTSMP